MENSYEIGITNRYSIFLNEEKDPTETLKPKEGEKEAKKKPKLPEHELKSKPETKVKPPQALRKGSKEAEGSKTPNFTGARVKEEKSDSDGQGPYKTFTSRGERGGVRNPRYTGESREEANNKRNRDDRFQNGGDRREQRDRDRAKPDSGEFRTRERGERGGGRGAPGRGRFNRGGRGGFDGRGRRMSDRQSGSDKTGVKPVEKREGRGPHNWGNQNDVAPSHSDATHAPEESWEEEKPEESQTEVNKKDREQAAAAAPSVGSGDTTQGAEEPVELTLDEYKALRGNRQKPTYNLRKPGEGEDLKQWKKMYALEKKKDGEEDEYEEYDASDYPQRVGRQKHVLDIDIHFSDSRRGTRGRGRGGPRSSGGRFGPRVPRGSSGSSSGMAEPRPSNGARNRQNAPKVDDERDFPSLG